MSANEDTAQVKLLAEFGKLFYDWYKSDPSGLIYENNADGCDIEIDRLVELIDYVSKKRDAVKRR